MATAAVPQTVVVKQGGIARGCLWAIGIFVLLVAGVILVVILAVGKAAVDLNNEQQAHAISKTQFDAVQLGIARAALEQQLGKSPENSQEFVTKGVLNQNQINSSCVYYNQVGHSFGTSYQFCFNGDALTTKNSYS